MADGANITLADVRLAILGNSATQFLKKNIYVTGMDLGYDFNIFDADYDQIEQQVINPDSELYLHMPEYVIVALSSEKLVQSFYRTAHADRVEFADLNIKKIQTIWDAISQNSNAKIIQLNFLEYADNVFGNYATKLIHSSLFQIKKINLDLMKSAQQYHRVFITDVQNMQNQIGRHTAFDPRLYYSSKVEYSLSLLPLISRGIIDIISAIRGKIKKCVIVDLDNTLWGGIIGDDGINAIEIGDLGLGHAFEALQLWLRELKNRGIILAVCSKNNEETAKIPFRDHPDMVLRLDDIAVFVANWNNKAENIKYIQSVLNIGFDSMVFIDDNPFERNLVREYIPEVTVPELPEDPSEYVSFLQNLNLFETASFSEEDSIRTKQYQEEAARIDFQKTITSIDDYLSGLEMQCVVEPFKSFTIPRVAQLSQRSNQFNLRTVRYSEADVNSISQSENYLTFTFTLSDRFGDHGLIGVIILKKESTKTVFIDTWIMSCRVLKRGMEEFMIGCIVKEAVKQGFKEITGEYIPTQKNAMVKEFYPHLGFVPLHENKWKLVLDTYTVPKSYIKEVMKNENIQ